MYNWKRKIEYSEYDSSVFTQTGKWDIRKERPKKIGEIEISFFQLLVSTARSVLTRAHVYTPETAAFARAYMETIPFLLDEKDGYLAINNVNKDILKDFSKSTRHGEIAQGINYFMAKNYLGAYAVYDFKYYAYKHKRIRQRCNGGSPDYVVCYPDKTIGILESKGTTAPDPTSYLITGHGQCVNGEAYLNGHGIRVANSYVSAVDFATSSPYMKRHTHVYLADPRNEVRVEEEDTEKNRLYEYSKWFYLAGREAAAKKLMTGENVSEDDIYLNLENNKSDGIIIGAWNIETESGRGNGRRVVLGITLSLADYLISGNANLLNVSECETSEYGEWFDDGTFIRIE